MFRVELKKQWIRRKTLARLILYFGLFLFIFIFNYYIHKGGFRYIEGYDFVRIFVSNIVTTLLPLFIFIDIIIDFVREYSIGTIMLYPFEDVSRVNYITSKILNAYLKSLIVFLFLFLLLFLSSFLFFNLGPYLIEDILLSSLQQVCRTAVVFGHYFLLINIFLTVGYLLVTLLNGNLATSLGIVVFSYFLYSMGHGAIRLSFFRNLSAISLILVEAKITPMLQIAIIKGFGQLLIVNITLFLVLIYRFSVVDILSNERG